MKQLLLKAFVCCAALLPLSQAQARTFGDFAPGKTFTLEVSQVVCVKGKLGSFDTSKSAIPAGVPNFKKGQKVKFTIGAKGQLTGNGFSIPFKSDGGTANSYAKISTAQKPSADIGTVHKDFKNRPVGTALSFFKFKYDGVNSTIWSINYVLK